MKSLVLLLLVATSAPIVNPFSPSSTTTLLQKHDRSASFHHIHPPSHLSMTTDPSSVEGPQSDALAEAKKLRNKALQLRLEADRQRAQLNLDKIAKLEASLLQSSTSSPKGETKNSLEMREEVRKGIEALVREVDPSLLSEFESSSRSTATTAGEESAEEALFMNGLGISLTSEELSIATEYYLSLPPTIRRTLSEAVGLEFNTVSPAVVVLNLYETSETLDLDKLRSIYRRRKLYNKMGAGEDDPDKRVVTITLNSDGSLDDSNGNPTDEDTRRQITSLLQEIESEITAVNANITEDLGQIVQSLLPRTTRPGDGRIPNVEDVEILTQKVLNKDNFLRSGKAEPFPGGFLIRGKVAPGLTRVPRETRAMREERESEMAGNADYSSSAEPTTTVSARLLSSIDASLDAIDPTWNEKYQVSYVYDVTLQQLEEDIVNDDDLVVAAKLENGIDDPVLLVTARDFSPEKARSLLRTSVTLLSFFGAAIFLVTTYANTESVVQRLTEANEMTRLNGANPDISWFNDLLYPSLVALLVPQIASEFMHQFLSRKDGFKSSAPTVLPALNLPYLSFQTTIKTSPPNPSSLFDYAIAGPAAGMLLSAAFFAYGLRLTLDADPAAMAYAPSVPVSFLQFSTLFGTIVDYVLSGGDGGVFDGQGVILSQSPDTAVPLHPYAIAGIASFLIHSLDVIPVGGSTDGSRMSQALLGRKEHLGFSAGVGFVLLVYTLLGQRTEILGAYLISMWFVQKDGTDVLCRDEVEKAGLGRAAAALVVWSLAVLALTPIG